MAIIGGATEYIMTDGLSGWVPLIAGLTGILLGPVLAAPIIVIVRWLKNKSGSPSDPERQHAADYILRIKKRQKLKLYEIACWLAGDDAYWPLPSGRACDEYNSLLAEIKDNHQNVEYGYEAGFMDGDEEDGLPSTVHELERDRRIFRKYLRSVGRPIPEFLNERFDED